jgi:hypothetical protein
MSSGFGTATATLTFTITDARYLASKVETDLKRVQRLYNREPTDIWIAQYGQELVELLKSGYLAKVTYGFRRDGRWVEPTLIYTARELQFGFSVTDDDPGRVRPGADIAGAAFGSFLEYSAAWHQLSALQQTHIEARLPFRRARADEPLINGHVVHDLTYSSGSRALNRGSVRSGQ